MKEQTHIGKVNWILTKSPSWFYVKKSGLEEKMLSPTGYWMRMPNSQLPGDLTQKGSESNMRISKLWNHHTIVLETANDLDHNTHSTLSTTSITLHIFDLKTGFIFQFNVFSVLHCKSFLTTGAIQRCAILFLNKFSG